MSEEKRGSCLVDIRLKRVGKRWGGPFRDKTQEFRSEMSSDLVGDSGDAEQWSGAGCLVKAEPTGRPDGTA